MSNYKYSLHNYHAIEQADILVNGITVLSGENGCGKSTLSRWLYYIVNGTIKFDVYLFREYVDDVLGFVNSWGIVSRDILRVLEGSSTIKRQSQFPFIQTAIEQLNHLVDTESFHTELVTRVQDIYAQTLHAFVDQLYIYLNRELISLRKERILGFLNVRIEETDSPEEILARFVREYERLIDERIKSLFNCLENRRISELYKIISNRYKETDYPPVELQLFEDGVELFDAGHISSLYNLRKAIYVDTPMAIGTAGSFNIFWRELRNLMYNPLIKDCSRETKVILRRVKQIIGGEVKLIEDEFFTDMSNLHYVSDDGTVDIELAKAATGVKTFSYLQQLLQNGYLTDETLLLIDEPEAHLHPQWIVEYARLLVLLYKKLGVKIMIASHNPDMVAAIRSIAEKEEVLSDTRFYIAEKHELNGRYVYRDLEQEIGDIFHSFNIALDRIHLYGSGCF